jgi:dihydrofolate synthase/folylpolyglutamate synthase
MSFVAALDHLHSLAQELAPASANATRRKFDLEHMRILARALGEPQKRFPAILIAGTNGKGSTGATLAAVLAAAGYRTGLYTSPHLSRVTERICISQPATEGVRAAGEKLQAGRVNQQPATANRFFEIAEDDFARLYFHVDEIAQSLVNAGQLPNHPSFFETLTALAFLYFAERQIDIAVLEVGMGGRLDATNIVEPILSVITDIALDHQDYLGSTITAIAREKAGILRAEGTLITLPQHPEANQAIGEAAISLNVDAINAADYLPGRNFRPATDNEGSVLGSPSSIDGSAANARSMGFDPQRTWNRGQLPANHYDLNLNGERLQVRSPLAGEHQRRNIALAIAAAIELRNHESQNNLQRTTPSGRRFFTIPTAAIEAGIANTSWPGRLEFLPPNLLLDVAHNPAGAWTLRAAIATLPESRPRTLIFSCLRDKDLSEMAQILFPLFDATSNRTTRTASMNLILTPIHNPRAASLDDLLAAARSLDIPANAVEDPAQAFALARSITPVGGLIIATGSIYLVGALRDLALAP